MRVCINPSSQDWSDNGVNEGKVQHIIGYKLAAELQRRGHVTMVTNSLHDLPHEMAMMAAFDPDIAISLHNDGAGHRAMGFQVIWQDGDDVALRDRVEAELAKAFPHDRVFHNERNDLYVLHQDHYPFVLVELLNAEYPPEAKRLLDPREQDKMVGALATALVGAGSLYLRLGRRDMRALEEDVRQLEYEFYHHTSKRFPKARKHYVAAGIWEDALVHSWEAAPVHNVFIGPYGRASLHRMEGIAESQLGYTAGQAVIVGYLPTGA